MKVLKFGGTSVGSVESLKNVKNIVESQDDQVIVVVSALGGVTDLLLDMTHKAEARDDSYEPMVEQLLNRHNSVIEGVVPANQQAQCKAIMQQFIVQGLTQFFSMLYANQNLDADYKAQVEDAIVAHGEAFRQAPLGETQSGKGGKEERAAHSGQRNKEHLGAKGADNLSQVVAATHAHANLEHQSIEQVERPVVHLLQTADEPAEQATRHKCADHKQTIPHFRPPF